ncbi:MAG TPA: asparaginase [Candidatus Eisenbacteria bacterium]|nr:asparaginase [Candidatus Eisenbacteria bacterium]
MPPIPKSVHETERPALAVDPETRAIRSEPLAQVLRAGHVESIHRGHVAVVDAAGRLLARAGEPRLLVFPRSTFKPFQALPFVRSGAFARSGLGDDALALIAGSHGGSDIQADLAREILSRAGVDEGALRCGTHTPYDEATAAALRERRERPGPLRHNCSGKHAGMLLYAQMRGDSLDDYVDPNHPVQREIFDQFSELVGEPFEDPVPAVDGCSAPTPRIPLHTLARAFALLARGVDHAGKPVPALARIRDAMRAHPEMVAGEGRLDTIVMRAVGNVVCKAGAEAVHGAGLLDRGVGIAVKVEDGSRRALGPAAVGVLGEVGALGAGLSTALAEQAEQRIRNHAGVEVGSIRATVRLTWENA